MKLHVLKYLFLMLCVATVNYAQGVAGKVKVSSATALNDLLRDSTELNTIDTIELLNSGTYDRTIIVHKIFRDENRPLVIMGESKEGVIFRDPYLFSGRESVAEQQVAGFWIEDCQNIVVRDLTIRKFINGFFIQGGAKDSADDPKVTKGVIIDNCHIDSCGISDEMKKSDIYYNDWYEPVVYGNNNNHMNSFSRSEFYLKTHPVIVECDLAEDHLYRKMDRKYLYGGFGNGVIFQSQPFVTSWKYENNYWHGVTWKHRTIRDSKVLNCTIENNRGKGVFVNSAAKNILIDSNVVKNCYANKEVFQDLEWRYNENGMSRCGYTYGSAILHQLNVVNSDSAYDSKDHDDGTLSTSEAKGDLYIHNALKSLLNHCNLTSNITWDSTWIAYIRDHEDTVIQAHYRKLMARINRLIYPENLTLILEEVNRIDLTKPWGAQLPEADETIYSVLNNLPDSLKAYVPGIGKWEYSNVKTLEKHFGDPIESVYQALRQRTLEIHSIDSLPPARPPYRMATPMGNNIYVAGLCAGMFAKSEIQPDVHTNYVPDSIQIHNNIVDSAAQTGIEVYTALHTSIIGNTVKNNGATGIQLEDHADYTVIANNTVSNNSLVNAGECGIWIDGSEFVDVRDNVVFDEYFGIYAWKHGYATMGLLVRNNSVYNCVKRDGWGHRSNCGIAVTGTSLFSVYNNSIHNVGLIDGYANSSKEVVYEYDAQEVPLLNNKFKGIFIGDYTYSGFLKNNIVSKINKTYVLKDNKPVYYDGCFVDLRHFLKLPNPDTTQLPKYLDSPFTISFENNFYAQGVIDLPDLSLLCNPLFKNVNIFNVDDEKDLGVLTTDLSNYNSAINYTYDRDTIDSYVFNEQVPVELHAPFVLNPDAYGTHEYLTLLDGSSCAENGAFLTAPVSSGSGDTIAVGNALYFSDGLGIGKGDIIRIGDIGGLEIEKIIYEEQKLIISEKISWTVSDSIALDFSGSRPNIGSNGAKAVDMPGKMSVRYLNARNVTLSWEAYPDMSNLSHCNLAYSVDGQNWENGLSVLNDVVSIDVNVSNMPLTEQLFFRMCAVDLNGNSSAYRVTSIERVKPEFANDAAVEILSVSHDRARISWTPANDPNVNLAGYKVYYNGVYKTVTEPTVELTQLAAETKYTFSIVAFDVDNNTSIQPLEGEVTTTSAIDSWAVDIAYEAGDIVMYNGVIWTCQTDHTSLGHWYPGALGVYLWVQN